MFFFFFFIFFPSGLIDGVLGLIFLSFYLFFSSGRIDDFSRFSFLGLICFSDSLALLSGFLLFLFFVSPRFGISFFFLQSDFIFTLILDCMLIGKPVDVQ